MSVNCCYWHNCLFMPLASFWCVLKSCRHIYHRFPAGTANVFIVCKGWDFQCMTIIDDSILTSTRNATSLKSSKTQTWKRNATSIESSQTLYCFQWFQWRCIYFAGQYTFTHGAQKCFLDYQQLTDKPSFTWQTSDKCLYSWFRKQQNLFWVTAPYESSPVMKYHHLAGCSCDWL